MCPYWTQADFVFSFEKKKSSLLQQNLEQEAWVWKHYSLGSFYKLIHHAKDSLMIPCHSAKIVYLSIVLQVMYGGRAIDDFDRRVLKIYMDEYMGDFIFDTFQPFHFYHNQEVDYVIPPDGTRDSYMEYIDTLPLANTPEVFGLHTNAEIGYFTRAAKNMWAQLMELQPQTGEASTGMSREEFIGNIASDIQVRDICARWLMFLPSGDVMCTVGLAIWHARSA